ncbi:methionyl-tRNA formyltransferase [Candidatus Sumerlaeota bacterium]|nr:methionyl-tRNA formyltransferase [Candidatus Sumerlaeota bacterium]
MRIVYMGTPDFAVAPLMKLIQSAHEVVAVVTQPDKPVGRGRTLTPPPVKTLALKNGLPVLQPEKIKGMAFDKELAVYSPDCIVVAAYGKILPKEVLELPTYGCINIHASLLPKYRGAAPIQRAIIDAELKTGVSIMVMEEGLDTGAIISCEELDIIPDDDASLVSNALSLLGAGLLIKELDKIEKTGKIVSTPQDESKASYAPMLKKSDGLIDWTQSGDKIICHMMGMRPWPTAFSYRGKAKEMWKFLRAESLKGFEKDYADDGELVAKAAPGTVTALVKGRGFLVRTGDQHLLITEAQPQGKRAMSGADIINGNLLNVGDVFLSENNE